MPSSRELRRLPHDGPLKNLEPLLRGGILALLSAVAFGVTIPLIQRFGVGVSPISSATLLYAGACLASLQWSGTANAREAPLRRTHMGRLVLVAVVGALIAPVCLTWGLQHTSATSASLLLNFEAIFTVVLASIFFQEAIGRRVVLAVVFMISGGAVLVIKTASRDGFGVGAVLVLLAVLAWAVDNVLTRPLADLNPTQVVRWKAALGAAFGGLLSLAFHQSFPRLGTVAALLACGATGYGLSLRLYLLAQRRMGAGRTSSIFAIAPFVGVAAAWVMGDRTGSLWTVLAGALFAMGVFVHLTETHGHSHTHQRVDHEHRHRHDDGHHDHTHVPPVEGEHSHPHHHEPRTHRHPHAPDIHHRHGHRH